MSEFFFLFSFLEMSAKCWKNIVIQLVFEIFNRKWRNLFWKSTRAFYHTTNESNHLIEKKILANKSVFNWQIFSSSSQKYIISFSVHLILGEKFERIQKKKKMVRKQKNFAIQKKQTHENTHLCVWNRLPLFFVWLKYIQ